MLDIKFIKENKDIVQAGAVKKHITVNIDELLAVDAKRREIMAQVESKKTAQNQASEKIAQAQDQAERGKMIDEMKVLKADLQKDEEALREVMKEWQALMLQVPNVPDMSVPEGESDAQNQEVRTWGTIPTFDFEVKNHIALLENLDALDIERGVKIAGFRGYVLKNSGALLQFALMQFAIDHFSKKGLSPMIVPSLVKKETLLGTGYLPQGADDLYKTQDDDYLAGTGEVLAVPGSIFDAGSEGPHQLLRLGAVPITKSEDILDALNLKPKSIFSDTSTSRESSNSLRYIDCSPEEMKLLALLQTPLSKDNIIRSLSETSSTSQIITLISLLEIKGFIREFLGEFHLT